MSYTAVDMIRREQVSKKFSHMLKKVVDINNVICYHYIVDRGKKEAQT